MEDKADKILLSWTAPEFIFYPKKRSWFVVLGIVTAGVFVAAVLMKNYFFALLVPLATFLVYAHAKKQPGQITIEITEESIRVGKYLSFDHKDILSFWIAEEPETKILSLETKKSLQPKIFVLLDNQEATTVRDVLKNFIKEKRHEELFIDIIARKLKF